MTSQNFLWIKTTAEAAKAAGHVWPEMAACEAALESAKQSYMGAIYGGSVLALQDNNLFGTKQHTHPIYGTVILPTQEFLDGKWVSVNAEWIRYPDLAACFADRMNTLKTLAPHYPHYTAALAATDPITYVVQVSLTWSTGPNRGRDCALIYNSYQHMKGLN